jgi:glyoxylase-like metal-dependent hydrolase (beta-lactamase superfamily II)
MTLHLPGHTPGTTALLVGDRLLIAGDTVFVSGLGRPDLTGQADLLARELFRTVHERLRRLDPRTILAPAHWSSVREFNDGGLVTTTLADVFTTTLLNERVEDRFVDEVVNSLPAVPASYDAIRQVNAGSLSLTELEIERIDIGRNQCAAAVPSPSAVNPSAGSGDPAQITA